MYPMQYYNNNNYLIVVESHLIMPLKSRSKGRLAQTKFSQARTIMCHKQSLPRQGQYQCLEIASTSNMYLCM